MTVPRYPVHFYRQVLLVLLGVLFLIPLHAAQNSPDQQLQNQLKGHASPYLAMHGNDPVHWQEWGAEVLEKARRTNRLIFVSSGYFSCHWCHVMHRESYSDPKISALLNEYFIPVKIDRELRPALDDYLIDFVRQTTGQAGWPLNVFLTPEGYPLIGLTYAPPESFSDLLVRVSATWQQQSEKATRLARELVEHQLELQQAPATANEQGQTDFVQLIVMQALAIGDEFEGGFGNQTRFPMAPQLLVLLDFLRTHKNRKLAEFLTVTLDQMKNLGLRDQINGGFYRYTVDPAWTEPHFEKMLYTQALLVRVYLDAAEVLQRPDYLQVARDTLDFVLRDMQAEKGGYLSSFSAVDAKGREGTGYLWQQHELVQILTKDEQQVARLYWALTAESHFEMGNLPVIRLSVEQLASRLGKSEQNINALIQSARKKMRARNKIALMPVDDKVLTAWNALLLSALSQAAMQLKDATLLEKAKALRDFLIKNAWDGARLSRARDDQKAIGRAGLEDYAYLARALADYSVLNRSEEDWHLSNMFAAKAWLHFYHVTGWKTGDENLLPGMSGQAVLADGALPAADAVLLGLSFASDNRPLKQKAEKAVPMMLPSMMASPFSYASHAMWLKLYQPVAD